jgi:hypothetical protein
MRRRGVRRLVKVEVRSLKSEGKKKAEGRLSLFLTSDF